MWRGERLCHSYAGSQKKLDDGWPESVEEHSERYMYEDIIISMKHEYKNIR